MKPWTKPHILVLSDNSIRSGPANGHAEMCKCQFYTLNSFLTTDSAAWGLASSYGCAFINGIAIGSYASLGTEVIWSNGTGTGTDTVSANGMPCS